MKGYYAYSMYSALSLHFNKKVDYNAVKYNFKTKTSLDTFKKNPHRWQYVGIENNCENVSYSIFSVYEMFGFDFVSPKQIFLNAKKFGDFHRQSYLDKVFKKDLLFLAKAYNQDLSGMFLNGDTYPLLYEHFIKEEINLRTMLLLSANVHDFIKTENSKDIIAWPNIVKELNAVRDILIMFYSMETVDFYIGKYLMNGQGV